MLTTGIGDLAQSLFLRRDNARLNNDLTRLSQELASGRKSELALGISGDIAPLTAFERDLSALAVLTNTASEARLAAETTQGVLARMSEGANVTSTAILQAKNTKQPVAVDAAARTAKAEFEAAVAGLNTQLAGRSLFAGQGFDGPALADAATILADLVTLTAAEVTAADVAAAVDTYFAPGGDFETLRYLGDVAEVPVRLGDGEAAEPTLLASDRRIVETLVPLAKMALLDEGVLTGLIDERAALASDAGEELLTSIQRLTEARAQVGAGEETIERAATRIAAETSATELARNEIVAADPFETAIRLREVEVQLQSLYTITGRLSGLSLTNFLR